MPPARPDRGAIGGGVRHRAARRSARCPRCRCL